MIGTPWHGGCNREGRTKLLSLGGKQKLGEEKMKKTLTTITLAATMLFGATFANAGIIIGDLSETKPCTEASKEGIIIGDRSTVGIIIGDIASTIEGIIIGDKSDKQCQDGAKEGIIIGNEPGIIIGD
jgi:hypothetical protein